MEWLSAVAQGAAALAVIIVTIKFLAHISSSEERIEKERVALQTERVALSELMSRERQALTTEREGLAKLIANEMQHLSLNMVSVAETLRSLQGHCERQSR